VRVASELLLGMQPVSEFLKWLPGVAPRKAYTLVIEGDLLSRELKGISSREAKASSI